MPNILFYGDNLDVLRKHVKDESVDLIYLDPPFNSKRDYNVIFRRSQRRRARRADSRLRRYVAIHAGNRPRQRGWLTSLT